MPTLLRQLLDSLADARPVAYCRLVETRGSTPQKAGATMLVYAEGAQEGTLGGGCVEAEVKRRALVILDSREPAIVTFQLDNDYGWDDGLICGGRMNVLIDPLCALAEADYFETLDGLARAGEGCIEAVVFDAAKSSVVSPAAYLFGPSGRLVAHRHGPLDDGHAPVAVRDHLPALGDRPKATAVQGVAYLPTLPRCRLLIVGGGHVGQAVGQLAAELDFDVWVVDDRAEYASRERFPRAQRLLHGDVGAVLRDLEITANTYCLIVTRGHNHDEEALFHLVGRGARYVGMIGSSRKIKLIFDDLLAEGVPRETLSRVYAPVGIDIGSQTVPEIAISILAELVAHRNLGGQVPGRPQQVDAAEA